MTLGELQHAVNLLVKRGADLDAEVRVTTADASIGGRSSVGVEYIYSGFDWEQGEIRIETDTAIFKNSGTYITKSHHVRKDIKSIDL
jgi:hypothetical protein